MDPTVGTSAVPSSGSRIVSASRSTEEDLGASALSTLSHVGSVREFKSGALEPDITPTSGDAAGGTGGITVCHNQGASSIGGGINGVENIVAASPHDSKYTDASTSTPLALSAGVGGQHSDGVSGHGCGVGSGTTSRSSSRSSANGLGKPRTLR